MKIEMKVNKKENGDLEMDISSISRVVLTLYAEKDKGHSKEQAILTLLEYLKLNLTPENVTLIGDSYEI